MAGIWREVYEESPVQFLCLPIKAHRSRAQAEADGDLDAWELNDKADKAAKGHAQALGITPANKQVYDKELEDYQATLRLAAQRCLDYQKATRRAGISTLPGKRHTRAPEPGVRLEHQFALDCYGWLCNQCGRHGKSEASLRRAQKSGFVPVGESTAGLVRTAQACGHKIHLFNVEGLARRRQMAVCSACGGYGTVRAVKLAKECRRQLTSQRRRVLRRIEQGLHPTLPFRVHGGHRAGQAFRWLGGADAGPVSRCSLSDGPSD